MRWKLQIEFLAHPLRRRGLDEPNPEFPVTRFETNAGFRFTQGADLRLFFISLLLAVRRLVPPLPCGAAVGPIFLQE